MRADSDIRSKDHICPKKADGPGPGSYGAKSSFQMRSPLKAQTTFGKAGRQSLHPKTSSPGPNQYSPDFKRETNLIYSFPKDEAGNNVAAYKS
jgi:hypothetical protein